MAERLAAHSGPVAAPVTYIATGLATDDDMARRIAAHRARRPPTWSTVEAGGGALTASLAATAGTVLVDSLGTWVAGHPGFVVDVDALCHALRTRSGDTVVVSDEAGMGVHPSTDAGRRFRDALGEVNRAVAEVSDRVLLAVAGRALDLERL